MKTALEKLMEALDEMGLDYTLDDFDELYPELATVYLHSEDNEEKTNSKGLLSFNFDKETGEFLSYNLDEEE